VSLEKKDGQRRHLHWFESYRGVQVELSHQQCMWAEYDNVLYVDIVGWESIVW